MPDTHPSSDVLERVKQAVAETQRRLCNPPFYSEEIARAAIAAMPTIERLSAELERTEARIGRTMAVIENGYGVGKYDKCPHDRYGYEDCIACYDEALTQALSDTKAG